MRRVWFIYAGLLLFTAAVYWPVLRHGFINYDDPPFVYENPHLKQGLSSAGIAWAFREPLVGNWQPITSLSLLLNWQFCGLNPVGYHLLNLLFHAANVLLLFHVLRRMTGDLWPPAIVALLFAIHPLQVESVAWVAERKNVLSLFWGLLALWSYWHYTRTQNSPWNSCAWWLTIVLFALGLMSKPILVTWPFVLLLLDFWPLKRFSNGSSFLPWKQNCRLLLVEKAPFFILSFAMCVVTVFTHEDVNDLPGLEQVPLSSRISNTLISYVRYLAKTIWPSHLALPYPYVDHWPLWQAASAALLLGAITMAVLAQMNRRPFLFTGWFLFLGVLVPVIGILQEGGQAMADRHMYIAGIGLSIVLVWGAADLVGAPFKPVWAIFVILPLLACALLTERQIGYWRDGITLFQHATEVASPNALGEIKLAESFVDAGQLDQGIHHFGVVLKLYPTLPEVHAKMAQALARQGDFANSVSHYYAALRGKPDDPEMLNNLAWILASCRDPKLRNGSEAVRLAEHACDLTGHQQTIYLGTLAAAYAEDGRFDDAVATAQQACDLAASHGDTALLQRNQELMALYRSRQPVRE